MQRYARGLVFVVTFGMGGVGTSTAQTTFKAELKGDAKADSKGAEANADASGTAASKSDASKADDPGGKPPGDGGDPTAGAQTASTEAGNRLMRKGWEDVVTVPRKAVLKEGRVELQPGVGMSINDVLIKHYALGGQINYFLTDVMQIGLEGQYMIKEASSRESLVGLQYNRVSTLNRYKYSAALNFGYAAGYGKFAMFNRYIVHWELVAMGGVGVVKSEIIPRIPGNEVFGGMRISPNFGFGTRVFLNDWMTFNVMLRDYVFPDKFEPTNRTKEQSVDVVADNAESAFVNNVVLSVSVGFFLPTSFQYRTGR